MSLGVMSPRPWTARMDWTSRPICFVAPRSCTAADRAGAPRAGPGLGRPTHHRTLLGACATRLRRGRSRRASHTDLVTLVGSPPRASARGSGAERMRADRGAAARAPCPSTVRRDGRHNEPLLPTGATRIHFDARCFPQSLRPLLSRQPDRPQQNLSVMQHLASANI